MVSLGLYAPRASFELLGTWKLIKLELVFIKAQWLKTQDFKFLTYSVGPGYEKKKKSLFQTSGGGYMEQIT